jgi:hypothetical protein
MKGASAVTALFAALLCVGCSDRGSPAGPSSVRADSLPTNSAVGQPATAATVPFKGTLEGSQTTTPLDPPLAFSVVSATGTATHLGRFTLEIPHTVNFATATGDGTYTFTAANGDTLTADFTGEATVGPIISIVEHATITGGTGRFAGAAGTFTAHRLYDPVNGRTTGSFEGPFRRLAPESRETEEATGAGPSPRGCGRAASIHWRIRRFTRPSNARPLDRSPPPVCLPTASHTHTRPSRQRVRRYLATQQSHSGCWNPSLTWLRQLEALRDAR